jgi:streptogramin lyase
MRHLLCFLLFGAAVFAQTPAEYSLAVATNTTQPAGVAKGPDGNLWYTKQGTGSDPSTGNPIASVGYIPTSGGPPVEFAIPAITIAGALSQPNAQGIAAGPNGTLWFTSPITGSIGSVTTSGSFSTPLVTQYAPYSQPQWIVLGPDNEHLWFTDLGYIAFGAYPPSIGSIDAATNQIVTFALPNPNSLPGVIAVGPDAALWFIDYGTDAATGTNPQPSIGTITTSGSIKEYPLTNGHTLNAQSFITAGPDGALWFTTSDGYIGRITTAGSLTYYQIPVPGGSTSTVGQGIVTGPDSAIWLAQESTDASTAQTSGQIGRFTPATGVFQQFPIPTQSGGQSPNPLAIVVGPDNGLWFTDYATNSLGAIQPPFHVTCSYPASAAVNELYTGSCSAANGVEPYTYSFIPGSGAGGTPPPPGLANAINVQSGNISGTPTAAGTYSFAAQATDSAGQTTTFPLTVSVAPPLSLSCNFSSVAAPQVGVPYFATCTASGGLPAYAFSISAGQLPSGLTLNAVSGAISGAPTQYGIITPFTVQASDSGGHTASDSIMGINVLPPVLTISCRLSTLAEVGVAYSEGCTAKGGVPPYNFTLSTGSLPTVTDPNTGIVTGVKLGAATGAISGTPPAGTAGAYSFTVSVSDSGQKVQEPAQTAYTPQNNLTVLNPVLGIDCRFTAAAQVGRHYSTSCLVSNGTPPYTFSISKGSLPATLTIASGTGVISGMPTAAGTTSFTVKVTDSESTPQTAIQIVPRFVVEPTVLTIVTASLPNGFVNTPYSGNPIAEAGVPPFSWSVSAGTLPAGLHLNATTGAVTGTPSTAAVSSFTLQVKDSSRVAQTTSHQFNVTISGAVAPNYSEYALPGDSGVSSLVSGPDDALWFTTTDESSGNQIGRITTGGVVTVEFPAPNALATKAGGAGIAVGPDGALWFAETDSNRIGQITTTGASIDFGVPTVNSQPQQIVVGADGALWFTEEGTSKIARLTTTDGVTEYPTLTAASAPLGIVAGPDEALWFTENAANRIGRITTAGVVTEYVIPTAASEPSGIAVGPDGALWFTESATSKIGRIAITGTFTEYVTPSAASGPQAITAGADGALWFTELSANRIGRITTDGVVTEYPIPTGASGAQTITLGPDGAIWLGENAGNQIARFTFVPVLNMSCSVSTSALQVGKAYSATCTSTGGIQPYTYKISSGSLPPGVVLNPSTGAIGGTPTLPGTFSYTVQVTDASSPSQVVQQQIAAFKVAPLPLMLTCSLPGPGQVGTPYSGGGCSGVQGTAPYSYAVVAGALPGGLTLDPKGGAISGTPMSPGTFAFTIQVVDSGSPAQSVAQAVTLAIRFGTVTKTGTPLFTLNGFPATQAPAANITNLSLQLNQAAGVPVSGTLALSFAPYAGDMGLPASGNYMDPALQFVDNNGNKLGSTYNITIPASATSVPLPNIDPGTVAGGITATLTMGTLSEASSTITVQPLVPQIEEGSVQITNVTANSFDVELVANSTTRDLQYVTFSFTAAAGSKIVGDTTFTFAVSSLLSSWFSSQEGLEYGGAFSLTVPFTLSGSANAIQSVSVTLINTVGTSAPVSGSK